MNHVHEDIFKPEKIDVVEENGQIVHLVARWDWEQEKLVKSKIKPTVLKDIIEANLVKERTNFLIDKCRSLVTSYHHNTALIKALKVKILHKWYI
jgi:hypothetical protein